MDMYSARKLRITLASLKIVSLVQPKRLKELAAPIMAELEKLVVAEEQDNHESTAISLCLRTVYNQLNHLLGQKTFYESEHAQLEQICSLMVEAIAG